MFSEGAPPQVERPKLGAPETINPNWLTGFTEAEGLFFCRL